MPRISEKVFLSHDHGGCIRKWVKERKHYVTSRINKSLTKALAQKPVGLIPRKFQPHSLPAKRN